MIFQPRLIDEINGSVRQRSPDKRGNCVDNESKAIFGPTRSLNSLTAMRYSHDDLPNTNLPVVSQLAKSTPAFAKRREGV
jgi:hypothetical protein